MYYRAQHYTGDEKEENEAWKLWVPLRLRMKTISVAHDTTVNAHGGMNKTLQLLRRHLFWPGMVTDVQVRMYIDLLGPYPRSKGGYIGLLIVLDHMTKYHWLCPLKKCTSTVIQDFLQKQIFHVYGVPETIISDNGSQFRANDLNAFFTSLGINHVYTALYSPQSNASERVNRSLIAGIKSYLKYDHREWDAHLSAISCALRNSYHHV